MKTQPNSSGSNGEIDNAATHMSFISSSEAQGVSLDTTKYLGVTIDDGKLYFADFDLPEGRSLLKILPKKSGE